MLANLKASNFMVNPTLSNQSAFIVMLPRCFIKGRGCKKKKKKEKSQFSNFMPFQITVIEDVPAHCMAQWGMRRQKLFHSQY